ncbi:hypothetical protein RYJ27_07495 [Microbacterium limosum]|uniref:Uncharacterized protein n=1 Tax=Microbacterium limosum TaxID=3079935 RepID=A0AAU0MED7_9MICO|nr:hypothetical protein [Microbacterium sp. Y20]WOQ68574.1 hypothetical protein RYJ27_07495 [Microbacterium sp. Y20]
MIAPTKSGAAARAVALWRQVRVPTNGMRASTASAADSGATSQGRRATPAVAAVTLVRAAVAANRAW